MDFDANWLLLSLIPGGIGFVLMTYGKKAGRWPRCSGSRKQQARLITEHTAMYQAIEVDVPYRWSRSVATIGAGPPAVIDASW